MVQYTTRSLPDGSTIRYRTNPPRDAAGKVLPTKKQLRAREEARSRMQFVANYMKITHPGVPPFTKQYGKLAAGVLKKNADNKGKLRSRIPAVRAKTCRKGSRIARCANVLRD